MGSKGKLRSRGTGRRKTKPMYALKEEKTDKEGHP